MKTKFKVEVNPFLQKAVIYAKIKNCKYEKTIYYESAEEWNSFEFNNKIFDIEFRYEGEFLVSIYPVKKNKVDFTKPCEVLLIINLVD